jgi:hypothetical protein
MSEIKGKVLKIVRAETGTGAKGNWSKQNFIIETEGQYPKKVCLQVWNDKCVIPNEGETGTFHYNPESREHNEKWYTDLRVWKIEAEKKTPITKEQKAAVGDLKERLDLMDLVSEDDDLPF